MTDTLLIVTIILLLAGFVVLLLRTKKGDPAENGGLSMLQNQIHDLNRSMETRMGDSNKAIQSHMSMSSQLIKEITTELTKVSEGNKQVLNVTNQLQRLQDILKNPKQRGVLGEYYLETVLKNVLPPGSYKMQYAFPDGDIVDAVILYDGHVIPIDSKFSLENYNRLLESQDEEDRNKCASMLREDLKNRIDETSKYVKPEDGTFEFAFMFIPSEGLYYDLLINKVGTINVRDLVQYAMIDKKVIIVSPTSLLAYLQTVIQGLRQIEFNKSTEEIKKRVNELGKHLNSYETFLQKLGNHLGTSVSMYNSAYKEFKKIDKDVTRITGQTIGSEPLTLEAPTQEEA